MKALRLLRVKHRSDGTKRRVVYATIPARRVYVRKDNLAVALESAVPRNQFVAYRLSDQRWRLTQFFATTYLGLRGGYQDQLFDYFEVV